MSGRSVPYLAVLRARGRALRDARLVPVIEAAEAHQSIGAQRINSIRPVAASNGAAGGAEAERTGEAAARVRIEENQ